MRRGSASRMVLVTIIALMAALASALPGCGQGSDPTTTAIAPSVTGATTTTAGGASETTTTLAPSDAPPTTQAAYTPPAGDPERAAIMDAQRAWMAAQGLPSDVVFVVDWLRVSQGWAHSQVQPESPDGTNKYEGLSFLLQEGADGWTVVDVFGAEGDVDVGPNTVEDYFLARYPSAPPALFP